jgi:hypothetical protein
MISSPLFCSGLMTAHAGTITMFPLVMIDVSGPSLG